MVFTSSYSLADNLTALGGLDTQALHFHDKGEVIPLKENGCWQIYRGILQVSQLTDNGEEILVGWAQAGSFVGLQLTPSQLDIYQAKALSDVYLRWYSTDNIAANPPLRELILTQTIKRLRQAESLLAIAGYKRVDERLQALLKLLAQEMGQPSDGGIRLSVRLTHQMLANAIGTTRVTITRLLGDLQTQGQVSFDDDRHLVIHCVD
ncbi:MAG: Crp/Fnr family transcriptional regulator [Synechocystis sp.]|nr:Crp/Fnr family transcriptional regulator [Synechocystis sp.]